MPAAGWLINKFAVEHRDWVDIGLPHTPLIAESNTVLTLLVALLFYGDAVRWM